jgi:hypothetical protein
LALLLRHRPLGLVALIAAASHFILKEAGYSGLPCPARELLGGTCPGCGLGSAIIGLARGEWREALAHHAFAPVFAAILLLVAGAHTLPAAMRLRIADRIGAWEERTAVAPLLLIAVTVYWLLRLP